MELREFVLDSGIRRQKSQWKAQQHKKKQFLKMQQQQFYKSKHYLRGNVAIKNAISNLIIKAGRGRFSTGNILCLLSASVHDKSHRRKNIERCICS